MGIGLIVLSVGVVAVVVVLIINNNNQKTHKTNNGGEMRYSLRHEPCDSCEHTGDTIHLCQVCTETFTLQAMTNNSCDKHTEKRWNLVKSKFPGVAETINDLVEKEENEQCLT